PGRRKNGSRRRLPCPETSGQMRLEIRSRTQWRHPGDESSDQPAGFFPGFDVTYSEFSENLYRVNTSGQPAPTAAVSLHNIVKFFGRFVALRYVSAEFAPARLYVVLGDNGAGKSTLLRVMTGLLKPSSGEIKLLGEPPSEVAHRFGYMGHAPLLYDELTGVENLSYFAGLYGISDPNIIREAIRTVGLDP